MQCVCVCVCVCVHAWSEESEALKKGGQDGHHFIFNLFGWSKGRWGKRNNLNTQAQAKCVMRGEYLGEIGEIPSRAKKSQKDV